MAAVWSAKSLCVSFQRTYKRMALSHLSPVAISPLRTRARFTGSLLIRFYPLHAVICSVSVFILTHNHTPLGSTSTGTGTLNTSDISQQVIPTSTCSLGTQKVAGWKVRGKCDRMHSQVIQTMDRKQAQELPFCGAFSCICLLNPWTVEIGLLPSAN